MYDLINQLKPVLEQSWWQGFAGFIQVLAALLAILSIVQAKKMFLLAKKERVESVEPSWDIIHDNLNTILDSANVYYSLRGEITLINSGYGPARNIEIQFKSENRFAPKLNVIKNNVIFPQETFQIEVIWNVSEPPVGTIYISCITRLGTKCIHKLHLKTIFHVDEQNLSKWSFEWLAEKKISIFKKVTKFVCSKKPTEEQQEIKNSIKKYYDLEQWLHKTFYIQEDGMTRGAIEIETKVHTQDDGTKIGTSTFMPVHKIVSIFGLCSIPPTAYEMQTFIPVSENKIYWNGLIRRWIKEGVIEKGEGYEEEPCINKPSTEDFNNAIAYALDKTNYAKFKVIENHKLVDRVREYFNMNDIYYETFSFYDIEPYLKKYIINNS